MFSEVSHRQSGIEKEKESPPFLCVEITIICTAGAGGLEIKAGVLMFGHSGNNMVKMSSSQVLLG